MNGSGKGGCVKVKSAGCAKFDGGRSGLSGPIGGRRSESRTGDNCWDRKSDWKDWVGLMELDEMKGKRENG